MFESLSALVFFLDEMAMWRGLVISGSLEPTSPLDDVTQSLLRPEFQKWCRLFSQHNWPNAKLAAEKLLWKLGGPRGGLLAVLSVPIDASLRA